MSENSCVKYLPVSVFATVMGLMGVTLAFERVGKIFHLNVHSVYVLLLVIVNIWFLFLTGTYLLKFLKFPEEVRKDFSHPVKLNFIPTFSISLILFSIGYFEISKTVSLIYWISGVVIHMLLLFYIINKWFFHDFKINVKNPAWFIPVVGPILAPISGAAFSIEASWFFYSIGIVLWLPIFSILLYRVIFNDPLPPKLLPTLFIMIAPPAVGFISYIKLSQQLDNFSRVLFYFGVFVFVLLLTFYGRFSRLPFFLSWWAYTFPMAAFTISIVLYFHLTHFVFFKYFALLAFMLTLAVVLIVLVKSFKSFLKGEICVEE